MKAIETTGKIDRNGLLRLDKPLRQQEKNVKIIILMPEENEIEDEKLWLNSISNNPAFAFLNDKEEDIYSLADGKPFSD